MLTIPIKLAPGAVTPMKAMALDAGYDLFALHEKYLFPGKTEIIDTGLSLKLPSNIFASIRGRSSFNMRGLLSHIGTIDAGYTGPIKVVITNLNTEHYFIMQGERIAQLIFETAISPAFKLAECLPETERGQAGFGSTGR